MKTKILIISIILLISCTKIVDYDFGENKKYVTVNSLFTVNQPMKVKISFTAAILDSSVTYVENAKVELWSKTEFIENLQYTEKGFYQTINYLPVENKEYTIKIKVDGFDEISATDSIPSLVNFKLANNKKSTYTDTNNYPYFCFDLNIFDNINKNFYEFFLPKKYLNHYYLGIFSSENSIMKTGNFKNNKFDIIVSFTDILFNNQVTSLNINYIYESLILNDNFEYVKDTTTKVFIIFNTISENYFKYRKSAFEISRINNNSFNEGQSDDYYLYTNVNNGLGIFAGYNTQTDTLIYEGKIYYENN